MWVCVEAERTLQLHSEKGPEELLISCHDMPGHQHMKISQDEEPLGIFSIYVDSL